MDDFWAKNIDAFEVEKLIIFGPKTKMILRPKKWIIYGSKN